MLNIALFYMRDIPVFDDDRIKKSKNKSRNN